MCKCVIYTPHCNYLVLKSTLIIQTGWSVWHVTICCTYHHTYVYIYNTQCIPAGYWHWCIPRSIPMHIPNALVRRFYTLSGFAMFTMPHNYFLNFLLVAPIFTFLLFNKDKYWKVKKEKTLVRQMRNSKNNFGAAL